MVDDLFTNEFLVKIFSDPNGVAQFERSGGLKGAANQAGISFAGVMQLFSDRRAWLVWGALEAKKLYRKFPIFSTNIRKLESVVLREYDELHKETARATENFRDIFNLIADNNPEEASSIIFDLLVNPGKVTSIKSKYKIPFTPAQEISIAATAGLSDSPVRMFFNRAVKMARVYKHKGPDVPAGDMPGLDALISNLVSERALTSTDQYVAEVRPKVRAKVLASFLALSKTDDAMMSDSDLFVQMIKTIQRELRRENIPREPIRFVDSAERPAIKTKSEGHIYGSIVVGAMLERQFSRMSNITGARFSAQQARYLNSLMGEGRMTQKPLSPDQIEVGSYVMLQEDIAYAQRMASSVFDKEGRAGGAGEGVQATLRYDARQGGAPMRIAARTAAQFKREIDKLPKSIVTKDLHFGDKRLAYPDGQYVSAYDAMEWLSKNARSDKHQRIAQFLLPNVPKNAILSTHLDSVTEAFYMKKAQDTGQKPGYGSFRFLAKGDFNDGTLQTANPLITLKDGEFRASTFLHEAIHMVLNEQISKRVPLKKGAEATDLQGRGLNALHTALRGAARPLMDKDFRTFNANGRKLVKQLGLEPGTPEFKHLENRVAYAMNVGAEIHTTALSEPLVMDFFNLLKVGDIDPPGGAGLSGDYAKILGVPADLQDSFQAIVRSASAALTGPGNKIDPDPLRRIGKARPTKDVVVVPKDRPSKIAEFAPGEAKRPKSGWRSPILEKLSGAPAYRVNRIERTKKGSDIYYLNAEGPDGGQLILTKDEIALRPEEFSLLDVIDGASIMGLEGLTQQGRKAVTEAMADARIGYQQLVLTGIDEFGNVQIAPRTMINNIISSFDRIERELAESISPEVAAHGLIASGMSGSGSLDAAIRIWKTHILTGLAVPRPAYFSNEIMGNFAQMVDSVGFFEAGQLSMMGSLAYVPFFGKSLQNAYFRLAAKHGGGSHMLPLAFSAMFNTSLDKILTHSDELMKKLPDGTRPTYAQFMRMAIDAGVDESIITPDFARIMRNVTEAEFKNNPNLYNKLRMRGFDAAYFQRIMQIKIKEVTRRQRLLFYSHCRINKGMTHEAAKRELHNTLYDWTYSVGKLEMKYMGRFVLFYTLVKNAMAQVGRSFFELSSVGATEYAKRYATGSTKLQRMELMSRLLTAEMFAQPSPFEDLTPQENRRRAAMLSMPDYLGEYPILTLGYMTPEALQIMAEGGFVRTHYARVFPKLTTTEFLFNTLDIAGALSAIAVAFGNKLDPDGSILPYSANMEKAGLELADKTLDQFFMPVYADVAETMAMEVLGARQTPRSEYGVRAKPGDMAMLQLLGSIGLGDVATVIDDPSEEGVKRITGFYANPLANTVLFSMPKTEIHRLRMMMSLMFPGMAPAEIRALAATDKSAGVRLELLANLMNVGKAVFYNGNNERYYELDDVRDAFSRIEKRLQRDVDTRIGGD